MKHLPQFHFSNKNIQNCGSHKEGHVACMYAYLRYQVYKNSVQEGTFGKCHHTQRLIINGVLYQVGFVFTYLLYKDSNFMTWVYTCRGITCHIKTHQSAKRVCPATACRTLCFFLRLSRTDFKVGDKRCFSFCNCEGTVL